MPTTTRHTTAGAIISLLAALTIVFGSAAPIKASGALTKKQAQALAATAKTPADHMKLAAYFKLEADRLDAEAQEHEQLAQNYRLNPNMTGGGKTGGNTQSRTFEHCEAAAKALREAAKSTRELVAEHEQMAKAAAK